MRNQEMRTQHGVAFITTKKGFCYLTIKYARRNFPIMRVRKYTIEAEEKRQMRRLYPDIVFDWKKIAEQLARKREVCRAYRTKGRRTSRSREPFYGVVDPRTRTVYVNDPTNIAAVGALLDAILLEERYRRRPLKSVGGRSTTNGRLRNKRKGAFSPA